MGDRARHRDTKLVLRATALANALSYLVCFAALSVLMLSGVSRALR